jgi:hypothetical protein
VQELVQPISPDLSKPISVLCFTAPSICKCMDGMLPCLYSKPEEYIGTWIWTDFIYTWPNHPRDGEPKLTKTDRQVIMILVVLTDIVLFLVCSYGLTRFIGEDANPVSDMDAVIVSTAAGDVSNVNVTLGLNVTAGETNVTDVAMVDVGVGIDVEAEAEAQAQEHMGFLVVCLVTTIVVMLETFIHWVLKLIFGIVQKFKNIYNGMGIVTIAVTSLYLVLMAVFIGVILTEVTCMAFVFNIIVPWVSSFPLGFLLSLVGPYGYLFHNSFGSGKSVPEAVAAQGGGDAEQSNPTFEEAGAEEDEEEESETFDGEAKKKKGKK